MDCTPLRVPAIIVTNQTLSHLGVRQILRLQKPPDNHVPAAIQWDARKMAQLDSSWLQAREARGEPETSQQLGRRTFRQNTQFLSNPMFSTRSLHHFRLLCYVFFY